MATFLKEGPMNSIDQLFLQRREEESRCNEIEKISPNENQKLNLKGVIVPVLLFEILVCVLGSQFFYEIGYSFYSSIVLAVTIEVFYMYFSSRRDIKSVLIKTVLLSISVTTLSFSAYTKDKNIQNNLLALSTEIKDNESRLIEVNSELKNLKKEELSIEKDMMVYREHELTTKGNAVLAPRRKELKERRDLLHKERTLLKSYLKEGNQELINQSFFKNIPILTIQTIISILVFTIIQICICIALPDLIEDFRRQQ